MMRRTIVIAWAVSAIFASIAGAGAQADGEGWIALYDGESLDGWKKAAENEGTFSIRDGAIVAHGPRSHLFYLGSLENADFENFELKVDVKTETGSNGGIYFHTRYREKGWPDTGFEVQVCNDSYRRDRRKTGSLYQVQDVDASPVGDREWFTIRVLVEGKQVMVHVNDKQVVNWVEPDPPDPRLSASGRVLRAGTFALQGHDPGSTVYYKNIYVKPLPPLVDYHVHLKGGLTLVEAIQDAGRRGARIGIAENCGLGFATTNDQALQPFLDRLEGEPVYRAMQAEGREWVKMFSPQMIAKFDYVFTDSMTFTDHRGKRVRLWIPSEVEVGDKQAFMDMLVEKTVGILNDEPIDIYVNPTFLPSEIAGEYDTLWTDARMDRVIEAAVRNGVAIEINARFKLPSEKFIRKAKAAGATFAYGTNNGDKDLGDLAYSREMARKCGLRPADMFTPKGDGHKPIQRKGLSR